MCQNKNIDIYKDGKDLYIRIKDCDMSIEKVLTSMVGATIKNSSQNISQVESVKSTPVKQEEAKIEHIEHKFTYGPYNGLTPKEVHLKIGAKKAFCYFVTQKLCDKTLKADVDVYIKYHKGFLNKRLNAEVITYDDKMVFFTEYYTLFKDKLDTFLASNGYNTISDFLNMESEKDTTKLYKEYISQLLQM